MSATETTKRLMVSRQQLHSILAEKARISPEMALRLGKFCGNGQLFGTPLVNLT